MRAHPDRRVLIAVAAVAIAGCGSSSDSTTPPPVPKPSGSPQLFPKAAGTSLAALLARYAPPGGSASAGGSGSGGPNFAPSVSILGPGENRVGFALFDDARKQITGAPVALYTAKADGTDAHGPYVARSESLAVKPAFESQTTASDPNAAKAVYVANVPFPRKGRFAVAGLARLDGRLVATTAAPMQVGVAGAQPPQVGQRAPLIHTPTLTSAGGDASKIDTRTPPAKDLLKTDFATVLGKKPIVLMMATPQLCQSRVCGPVVDVEEQVANTFRSKAVFIHQEIYKDNQVSKGFTNQVAAYHLPTEPWTFVIDRHGIVRARFEGALSSGELERAVAKVA